MIGDDVFIEHMYVMRARIDELTKQLTKRPHDKDNSVTKLQEKLAEKQGAVDCWRREYYEVKEELEASRKKLAEKPVPGWRGRYWEIVGKLAARRDECKYLVEQNEGLKMRVKGLGEGALINRGGFDCLADKCEDLTGKLKDLEDYHQEYYVKTQKKLHAAKIDQDHCHQTIAELRVQLNGILVKNIEASKAEKVMEDLVGECREYRANLAGKNKQIKDLETEVEEFKIEGMKARRKDYDSLVS